MLRLKTLFFISLNFFWFFFIIFFINCRLLLGQTLAAAPVISSPLLPASPQLLCRLLSAPHPLLSLDSAHSSSSSLCSSSLTRRQCDSVTQLHSLLRFLVARQPSCLFAPSFSLVLPRSSPPLGCRISWLAVDSSVAAVIGDKALTPRRHLEGLEWPLMPHML